MNLYLIAPVEGNGGWRLIAEDFAERQIQRLAQALHSGPAVLGPRTGRDGRRVFEYDSIQGEEEIVLHTLTVARQLKARVCLRGVPTLARA